MDDQYFIDKLEKEIENKNTRKNYVHRVNGLIKKLKTELKDDAPEHLIKHVLTHPRKYSVLIEKIYKNELLTVKNMFTLILAVFKYCELKEKYEDSYLKWKELHKRYVELERQRYEKNQPTQSQKDKYISYDDMKKGIEKLAKDDPHSTLKKSLEFCLVNMYQSIQPKRSDFGQIRLHKKDHKETDINYLVLSSKKGKSFFVFNHRTKTNSTEPMKEPITDELRDIFLESRKKHDRKYLFIGKDKGPFKTSNAFSKFVIRTFGNVYGKNTGVSLLRHAYINEKVDFQHASIEQKRKIADSMGHDVLQQDKYRLIFPKDRIKDDKK